MTTWLVDGVHDGAETVHWSVVVPLTPLRVVVGKFGLVIVAVPLTTVHVPVPCVTTLPAIVAVVPHPMSWAGPAFAVLTEENWVSVTCDVDAAQAGPTMVHCSTAVPDTDVTVEVARVGDVIVAVPLTTLQSPTPLVGTLPFKVADVPQPMTWLLPATDCVTLAYCVSVTSADEGVQLGAVTVQRNTVTPDTPVTVVNGFDALVIMACPD